MLAVAFESLLIIITIGYSTTGILSSRNLGLSVIFATIERSRSPSSLKMIMLFGFLIAEQEVRGPPFTNSLPPETCLQVEVQTLLFTSTFFGFPLAEQEVIGLPLVNSLPLKTSLQVGRNLAKLENEKHRIGERGWYKAAWYTYELNMKAKLYRVNNMTGYYNKNVKTSLNGNINQYYIVF